MRRNAFSALLALMLVFALALTACGSNKAAETTAAPQAEAEAPALGLTSWTMNATTWSSPNGATVHLTAAPTGYADGYSADFVVRLEGEEVANVPCEWDGTNYTASAELNADDGYCYYVILTAADGTTAEVPVNTPTSPVDETLINLASSLSTYCEVTITDSKLEDGKLVISEGSAKVQLPQLTLADGTITCDQALLIMSFNGEDVALEKLSALEADATGLCTLDLSGLSFSVPTEIEDDHQLSLRLDVTMSSGYSISVLGGTWIWFDGGLVQSVG